jgi:ankyrin repeat protein
MLWVLLIIAVLLVTATVAVLLVASKDNHPKAKHAARTRTTVRLSNAAAKGDAEAVQAAIEQGVNPNEIGPEQKRPLHWAAQRGHKDVVKLLIDAGADLNAKDKNGWTPLHLTCGLTRSNELRERHVAIADLLIEHRAGVNCRNNNGVTPLHLATKNERDDVVQLLLARHASANVTDGEGYTPLFLARHGKDPTIVKTLIDAGATQLTVAHR